MKKLFLSLALIYSCISFSQSNPFSIKGVVIDQEDNNPIESATIHLERAQDSTVVNYTISNAKGQFQLEGKTYDKNINLFVSFTGMETYKKEINLSSGDINLDTIKLKSINTLDAVLIKSRAPITIKKDTLEFNVKSFKTKKDASVEDLLKQLPGVEVDAEGKIKVNGKEVNKILVNGKPFFGNDPTITTRNLTKDIIEKIQITDTKTKSESFSGEEGDKDNKTINLTIKEENNKGKFGRLSAGLGTDKRYEFAGMINLFNNDRRISVLAGGNNINSAGFSFGEIRKMFGSGNNVSFSSNGSFNYGGRNFGGGQGIVKSSNYGVTYADVLSKKVDISADYFYSKSDSRNESSNERENFLRDSKYFSNASSTSRNTNDNHSANMIFDVKIDSTFLINIRPSIRKTDNISNYTSENKSFDELENLTNESNSSSVIKTNGINFDNRISLTKKYGNDGGYIELITSNTFNKSLSEDFLNSEINIYGSSPANELRDQFTDGDKNQTNFNIEATYRIPLIAKKLFLNLEYEFSNRNTENSLSTYDFNSTSNDYVDFNEDLSTDFKYINKRNIPSVSLSYREKKYSFSFKSGYVMQSLENIDYLKNELSLKRKFNDIQLRSYFNYRFNPKASVYMNYQKTNRAPGLNQIQPFRNISNPLNIITGNPNLEPENNHRFYLGYNAYNFQKGTGFYGNIGATIIRNQIITKSSIDDDLVRNTTYENLNGNYRVYAYTNYSKQIKIDTVQNLKFSLRLSVNKSKNLNYNNDDIYASKITSVTPRIGLKYTWKNVLEIEPKYSISRTTNKYDIDNFKDNTFLRHNFNLRTATFLPKNFEWRNDIQYNYNPDIAPGFQKGAWFWNSTLAYSLLNDNATLTLKAYDLLNQNTNARRTATENYIEDAFSTVLEQYFMLSFSWKFNSLGKKGEVGKGGVFFFD